MWVMYPTCHSAPHLEDDVGHVPDTSPKNIQKWRGSYTRHISYTTKEMTWVIYPTRQYYKKKKK